MAERHLQYDPRGILRRHCLLAAAPHSLNSSIQEVGDTSVTVQLTCPISLRRQVLPVRTCRCSHAQTFDLLSIPVAQRDLTGIQVPGCEWIDKCPICFKGGLVYIDREIRHYLQYYPSWQAITVSQTGIISEKVERAEEHSLIDLISPAAPRTQHNVDSRNIFTFPELNEGRRTNGAASLQAPTGRCVPRPSAPCFNHYRRPRLSTIDLLSP